MSSGISSLIKSMGVSCALLSLNSLAGTTHYVSSAGNHTPPFLTWETAATNIQSAIGVTTAGDLVLVTNGVYRTGGARTTTESLTNRVAITNAITVRSANGPEWTIIEGARTPGVTNGALSIRCVYLAAGATLDGFTLTNGTTTGSVSGAGAFCFNLSSVITNCLITGNVSSADGGGVYGGTIRSSRIEGNLAKGSGGGSSASFLIGCKVQGNVAIINGGGACGTASTNSFVNCSFQRNQASKGGGIFMSSGIIRNCTVVQNQAGTGGGTHGGTIINTIVYDNLANSGPNYFLLSAASFSCASPLPAGSFNISTPPLLLPDSIHLQLGSPCIARGTIAGTSGLDIDGSPWNSPPSIGCDEWGPEPLAVLPALQAIPAQNTGDIVLSFPFAGAPAKCQWFKDGFLVENREHYGDTDSSQLLVKGFGPADAGLYRVIATNAYGAATSSVMQVSVVCVDLMSRGASAPFATWQTAATNIQDAVDASQGTTVVLVTNGLYATGARYVSGYGTNRVVLDKAVTVASLNGPADTIIEGAWDPVSTNGIESVRCVWIGAEAFLAGFTLRNGSTTNNGGGVLMTSWPPEGQVRNCVITNCSAKSNGGGAYGPWLFDCILANNSAANGGGLSSGTARRSTFKGNSAVNGAGAHNSFLESCQVIGNSGSAVYGGEIVRSMIATNAGAGVSTGKVVNCRIIGNTGSGTVSSFVLGSLIKENSPYGGYGSTNLNCTIVANAAAGTGPHTNCLFAYNKDLKAPGTLMRCMVQPGMILYSPLPMMTNYTLLPNLRSDMAHIASDSACIGRGTNHGLVQFDLDGQPFANPPAIGCDEWSPEIVIAAQPRVIPGDLPGEAVVYFDVVGEPAQCVWFKESVPVAASGHYAAVDSSALKIRNFGPADSGSYQVIASNSFGMVTSAVIQVKVACVDAGSASPVSPYSTWLTAARTIQEAVDSADSQTVVVVTNGVYASGQRAVGNDTPNRLVVDKGIALISVTGAESTIIEGAWDPVSTNGAASVRCAWLLSEAMMGGFTFRRGSSLTNGGGVWVDGAGTAVSLAHCVVTNCSSGADGGGVFSGHVQESIIVGNIAKQGGGTSDCTLERSWVRLNRAERGGGIHDGITQGSWIHGNMATLEGGGVHIGAFLLVSSSIAFNEAPNHGGALAYSGYCNFYHCTIVSNTAWAGRVGGAEFMNLYNSIVYHNSGLDDPVYGKRFENIGGSSSYYYVCSPFPVSSPSAFFVTNVLPQLVDVAHLGATSPCIEAGLSLGRTGFTDIDGEPWRAKPSMGCDEYYSSGMVGPLSMTLAGWPKVAAGGFMPLAAVIDGRATGVRWDFGDGVVTNQVGFNPSYAWGAPGNYVVTATVFNNDHLEGVSATLPVQVVPREVPQFGEAVKDGNKFQVDFSSQPGVIYEVYSATNLVAPVDWKLLKRFYSSGPSISLEDDGATVESKFYRLEAK